MDERLQELGVDADSSEPWCPTIERDPAASGSLLAAYEAVDGLIRRVDYLSVTCAAADAGREEAQSHARSCEDRIDELLQEIVEVERDWDELNSRH